MSRSVLTSANNATVDVFDTIGNTAVTVSKFINGIGTSANMFERMMNDLDHNHELRSKINRATYEKELLQSATNEIAERETILQRKLQADPIYAKRFTETYKELQALLHQSETE